MKSARERYSGRLILRNSRIHPECLGTPDGLVFPHEKTLIKREEKTLIWRKALGVDGVGVVKMYRQRGFLIWHQERASNFRVQREFKTLLMLESAGVPCSAPLLWGFGSTAEHGRFEILVTREIPGAVNLRQAFSTGVTSLLLDHLRSLIEGIRLMHQCGVYHGALLPKNVLVTRTPERQHVFHLVDLARAIRFPNDVHRTAMARYDLLSLLHGLGSLYSGINCEVLLSHYGLSKSGVRELLDQLMWYRYRSTRPLRNRLAFIFQVRSLAESLRKRRLAGEKKT